MTSSAWMQSAILVNFFCNACIVNLRLSEPTTILLFGFGLLGLSGIKRTEINELLIEIEKTDPKEFYIIHGRLLELVKFRKD